MPTATAICPSGRIFSTDTTCFLAIESIFAKSAQDAHDPEAIAIATVLFDAIVNASELRLCLATSKGETDVSRRLSPSYKDVLSRLVHNGGHKIELPIVTTPNSAFEGRREYVQACFDSFVHQLRFKPALRSKLMSWFRANTVVGGQALRPVYSFPREYVSEGLAAFASQNMELAAGEWLYCFDFLMKNESYCRSSGGVYVPHTLRSMLGLRLMDDGRPEGVSEFRLTDLPIGIKFGDAVRPRLEAKIIRSSEQFFELALMVRSVLEKINYHQLSYDQVPEATQDISNECGKFFPAMSELQRDWSPIVEFQKSVQPKKLIRDAFVNFLAIKGLSQNFEWVNIGNDALEFGVGLFVAVGLNGMPVAARLRDHVILRAKQFIYCPLGAAFEVKIDARDHTSVPTLTLGSRF